MKVFPQFAGPVSMTLRYFELTSLSPIILSRSLETAAVVYRSHARLLRHRLPTALGFGRCILHLPPREVNRFYIFPFDEAFLGLYAFPMQLRTARSPLWSRGSSRILPGPSSLHCFAYLHTPTVEVRSFTFLETMISDTSNDVKRSLRLTRLSLCSGAFDRSTLSRQQSVRRHAVYVSTSAAFAGSHVLVLSTDQEYQIGQGALHSLRTVHLLL